MKKSVLATCVLLTFASQVSFATSNRVAALGGEPAMLADDDTNIDIFPQHINKQNLMRLTNIDSATPDYAIITGEKGKKWGLYGGTAQQSDFLNIYRSMGNDSAIKLGVAIGRSSLEVKANNKEPAPADVSSTETGSYLNLAIDGIYGKTKDKTDMAIRGFFSYGPNSIAATAGLAEAALAGPFGTYEYTDTTNTVKTDADGEANVFSLGGNAHIRKPMKLSVFNTVYATGAASYSSTSSTLSTGATKNEDLSASTILLSGRILMFNEKKINSTSRVIYGVGGQGTLARIKTENKVSSSDTSSTSLIVTGPQIRMGTETKLKYGTVRLGVARDFALFNYTSTSQTPFGATVNQSNSQKTFNIATSGTYSVTTGFGVEYNNLKLDLTINPLFWVTGPQMVFATPGTTGNSLAGSADMIYTF